VASKAQQLLEHSLLSELRAVVARALSGLEMFAGNQLTELDLLAPEGGFENDKEPSEPRGVSIGPTCWKLQGGGCMLERGVLSRS